MKERIEQRIVELKEELKQNNAELDKLLEKQFDGWNEREKIMYNCRHINKNRLTKEIEFLESLLEGE